MTTQPPGISFLGQSLAQSQRLRNLRAQADDLQRQMTTQKKYENLAGFGVDAQKVLQLRADRAQMDTYLSNIDTANTRISLIDKSMTQIGDAVRDVLATLRTQPQGGTYDMAAIRAQAQQMLDLVTDVANVSIDGRYLFAGTDTQTPPVSNKSLLNSNFASEMTDWLNGTNSTPQLLTNTDTFFGTNLGFSSTLSSAQDVSLRIDTSMEVTYGAIADRSGIQEAIRALAFVANLQQPNPATDTPDNTQFETVVAHIKDTMTDALEQMQNSQAGLSSRLELMKSFQESHQQDSNTFTALIDKQENVDTTQVVTLLQALQTQLTASYQVTNIVSQLSLTNFLS